VATGLRQCSAASRKFDALLYAVKVVDILKVQYEHANKIIEM